jgi:hypothetical protein
LNIILSTSFVPSHLCFNVSLTFFPYMELC